MCVRARSSQRELCVCVYIYIYIYIYIYTEEQRGLACSWDGATYQNDYLSLPFTLIDKSCYVNECSRGRGEATGEGMVRYARGPRKGRPRKDNEEIENLAVMRPVSRKWRLAMTRLRLAALEDVPWTPFLSRNPIAPLAVSKHFLFFFISLFFFFLE